MKTVAFSPPVAVPPRFEKVLNISQDCVIANVSRKVPNISQDASLSSYSTSDNETPSISPVLTGRH